MREVLVDNLADLQEEARQYIKDLAPRDGATIVGLSGNLGAGKTAFTKEVAKLLGIEDDVTSPTFVIQKSYPIDFQGFTEFIHIDAYRLETGEEMKPLKFESTLQKKTNLIFIEWPEHIFSILPEEIKKIEFETIDESTRKLTFYDKD